MNNKTSITSELITGKQLDVLFSTETWLKLETADKVLRNATPEDFRFFLHVSREVSGHRGTAIQFSKVLHGKQMQFDNKETFECVVTVLQHTEWEEPVLSINLYRPPKKNLTTIRNFLDEFQELLNQVYKNDKNIIVTGDFNIWVDCDEITYVKEFKELLSENGFDMHPMEPTHCYGHTLDLVLCKNVEISDVKVHDNISDHNTVYFNWRPVPRDKRK
ncbi:hypothetical protein OYC64_004145 [Pagothenia borchgrevinki]|uniref:Endonuclease/exonuclease/phosphatase domain-containing protein n=1 Tax=Pagothenia borchgrevinki TaxID=8213 RepID=A0ABD2FWL0_PAGBO